jgi:vancomycin aglycone glucosyltransferase
MRILLSTIGSRGDVQPLVALGLQLRAQGAEVRLCIPPDFRDWAEGLGFHVTPIGPDLRKATAATQPAALGPITPERIRQMAEGTLAAQFATIPAAAAGCDLVVGATALQIAAHSIAEKLRIPYVFVAFCPNVLPSPHHAPPVQGMRGQAPAPATADNRALWTQDAQHLDGLFGPALNTQRAALGLPAVTGVRDHIFTARPWLAADPILGPWPEPTDSSVLQTGAWLLDDQRPLDPELLAFLDAGEPPVYFGFGSMRAPAGLGETMIETARALDRRAIVSRGWAELALLDAAPDCLVIGEVNQQALFARVAAVVHHGGAGTTTAAALGGAPQVIVPQMYDQHYWARRIDQLGIGVAHAPGAPTAESLTAALAQALHSGVACNARAVATTIKRDGAAVAARRLLSDYGG